ncbi:MAG: YeeE/YedE family protein [Polyangiales bacterium]
MTISPQFAPFPSLLGGALIGLSASLFLFTHGRIAGISGLFGKFLTRAEEGKSPRAWFLLGFVLAGIVIAFVRPSCFGAAQRGLLPLGIAGLLVGVGTRVGNGCTSGHGVCGISRFSKRSIVATMTFMLTAIVTVFVMRRGS